LRKLTPPEQFVIWASRHYLWSVLRGTPVPGFVVEAFDRIGLEHLYYSLDRVLVCLMIASTERIVVHDIRCSCLSLHEQVLIMALKRAQASDGRGCTAAMTAIMLPAAARAAEPALKSLSAGMLAMRTDELEWVVLDEECIDPASVMQHSHARSETIN
jgi:hypothetical protein